MSLFSSIKDTVVNIATEHGSGILLVGGIVLGAGAIVAACVATRKVDKIMDEAEEEINDIELEETDVDDNGELVEQTEEQRKHTAKRIFFAKVKTAGRLVLNYGLTALLFGASCFCLVKSHNMDIDKYTKVVAAYNVLDQSFRQYRKSVIADQGPEADVRYKLGIQDKEIIEQVTNEKGKVKEVSKNVEVANLTGYARYFDELCPDWKENPKANKLFIEAQQEWANEVMKRRYRKGHPGYILLNEVYELLGYDPTEAGAVVGWTYDEENPIGDNYVDFGLYMSNRLNERFMNGVEPVAILDFNVDGVITGNRAIFPAI